MTDTNEATTGGETGVTEAAGGTKDYSTQISALVQPIAIGGADTKGATKAKQITILCKILTGEYEGKTAKYTGLLNTENQEQYDRTIESIEYCTSGSINEVDATGRPKGFGQKKALAVMAWEEVPMTAKKAAHMELKIVFLNDPTGARNALSDSDLGNVFKTLKKGSSGPKDGEIKDGKLGVVGAGGKKMDF